LAISFLPDWLGRHAPYSVPLFPIGLAALPNALMLLAAAIEA
jgi:hypothetical protein